MYLNKIIGKWRTEDSEQILTYELNDNGKGKQYVEHKHDFINEFFEKALELDEIPIIWWIEKDKILSIKTRSNNMITGVFTLIGDIFNATTDEYMIKQIDAKTLILERIHQRQVKKIIYYTKAG